MAQGWAQVAQGWAPLHALGLPLAANLLLATRGRLSPPLARHQRVRPETGVAAHKGQVFSSTRFQLNPPINLQLDPSTQNSLHGSWHDLEQLFETSDGQETWNGGRLRLQTAGRLGMARRLGMAW